MSNQGEPVVVEITHAAAKRVAELGDEVSTAVEDLRQELSATPRLRRLVQVRPGGVQVWTTRIEWRGTMPALSVTYVFVPGPWPPAAAIVSVVPDDGAEDQRPQHDQGLCRASSKRRGPSAGQGMRAGPHPRGGIHASSPRSARAAQMVAARNG